MWKILGHSINHKDIGIPEPHKPEELCNGNSKDICEELVASLLGGTDLNYVGYRTCICRSSTGVWKERDQEEMAELVRYK